MTRNELIEQIEVILEAAFVQENNFTETANSILSTILAVLQEPTEGMLCASAWGLENPKTHESRDHIKAILSAMLAASPLGEQSE